MKLQLAPPMLLLGSLFMSATAISTSTGLHKTSQPQATAELSGPGWKRLVESLNGSDPNTILDTVIVQCLLQSFVLGSSCRKLHTLLRTSSA